MRDCDEALRHEPEGLKSLLRRAEARLRLKQPSKAKPDFEAAQRLEPSSEAATRGLEQCAAAQGGGGGGAGAGSGGGGAAAEAEEAFDAYAVLGVARDASAADIKQAYRKAALKWHPDKVSGGGADAAAAAEAEARFKQISLAHSVLSDPAQRRLHDAGGKVDGGRATRPAYSTAT